MSTAPLPRAPYPGLRAFRPEEAQIFCGRATHRAEVLDLLGNSRFLAVVGASGSGKSSLVLAGLLPDIRDGQLIGVDGESVRIVSAQPGLRPFANLAEALDAELKPNLSLEPILRRGPSGLIQVLDEVENEPGRALVVVIDQFEEIFRFADMSDEQLVREERAYAGQPPIDGTGNEAQAFVNLLLQTAAQSRHVVFVLITMRSEFLARCDQFTGLPEAISRSQFLTPRLNRQQLEQAIVRPLDYFNARIDANLVGLILNQISPEQDQLPLMQHALARMWDLHRGDTAPVALSIDDYTAVGGLADALNKHGNDLCATLAAAPHFIPESSVEKFFRALAHHPAPQVAPVRRPVRVGTLAAETGLRVADVCTIADVFRAEGCHLVMPPPRKVPTLTDQHFLDISHESLLRQWKRLKKWLDAEWRQRRMAEELDRSMKDWEKNAPAPRDGPFNAFLRWKEAGESVATRLYRDAAPALFPARPSPALPVWARRYGIEWPRLEAFCRKAFLWKKVTSVMSRMGAGLFILTILLLVAVVWAVRQTKLANEREAEASASARAAQLSREDAVRNEAAAKESAEAEKKAADAAREAAEDAIAKLSRVQSDLAATNSADQSNWQGLSGAVDQLVRRLRKNSDLPSEIAQLLDSPELSRFGQIEAASSLDPPAPPETTVSAPVVLNLGLPPKSPAGPSVVFLKHGDRHVVLTGAKGVKETRLWTLPVADGSPKVLPFASSQFAVSPDAGAAVAWGDADKQVRLIDAAGEVTASEAIDGIVRTAVVVLREGKRRVLIGTGSGAIGFWDGVTGSEPWIFPTGERGVVNGLDLSPAGDAVLASGEGGWAKSWKFSWGAGAMPERKTPALQQNVNTKGVPVRHAVFDPGNNWMLLQVGTSSAEIRPADLRSQRPPVVLHHQGKAAVLFAEFSPDGTMIASADSNGLVYLWTVRDLLSGESNSTPNQSDTGKAGAGGYGAPVTLAGHSSDITALAWSPAGDYLVTADSAGVAVVWTNLPARLAGFNRLPFLLPRHEGGITAVHISSDGRLVATAGADGMARVYPLRAVMQGTFQKWGGPETTASESGGRLALLSDTDADLPRYRPYFLERKNGEPQTLVQRLNPESFYVCARWEYSFTPRSLLRSTKVRLRRVPPGGTAGSEFVEAQPVDWGPPVASGKAFSVSPGVITALGLADGDSIEMEIPVLSDEPEPPEQSKVSAANEPPPRPVPAADRGFDVTLPDEHAKMLPPGAGRLAVYLNEFSRTSTTLEFYIFSPRAPVNEGDRLKDMDFLKSLGAAPPRKYTLPVNGRVEVTAGDRRFIVTTPWRTAAFGKNDRATLRFVPVPPKRAD